MKSSILVLIIAISWSTVWADVERVSRCGGDGPKPFLDLGETPAATFDLITTPNGITDFAYSHANRTLFYRDGQALLHRMEGHTTQVINYASPALSPLVDPKGRYLLARNEGMILNTLRPQYWTQFSNSAFKHLYWNENVLFSIQEVATTDGRHTVLISQTPAVHPKPSPSCVITSAQGQDLALVKGSAYPWVWLQSSQKSSRGFELTVYKYDVESCRLAHTLLFTDGFKGPIIDVHRFEKNDSVAVVVDHPTHHFMWRTPEGCRFLDTENRVPLVPDYGRPIVATFSKREGLALLFPNKGQRARLPHWSGLTEVDTRNMVLTQGEDQLIFLYGEKGNKTIGRMQLKDLPTGN